MCTTSFIAYSPVFLIQGNNVGMIYFHPARGLPLVHAWLRSDYDKLEMDTSKALVALGSTNFLSSFWIASSA